MSSEIAALIQLLEDDSANVLEAVTDRLGILAPESLPALRAASEHENPKVRGRAREVLRLLSLRRAIHELTLLAESANPDLELMALHLARVQDPTLDFQMVRLQLDQFAEQVRTSLDLSLTGAKRIGAFLRVMHKELGFKGDTQDYRAYVNHFLHTTIERRRGKPIALVALYILIGQRVGLKIEAVGAPFRALAFFQDGPFETYIDAFSGGRLQSYHDCVSALRTRGMNNADSVEYLRRLSPREVVERMVRNLILFYDQAGRRQEGREFKRLEQALVGNHGKDRLY